MTTREAMMVIASALVSASVVTAQSPDTPAARPSAPVEKKSGCAPVNGLKIYYEIHGTGKPAVYIHPACGHSGVAPTLPANRQWIAVDLQGHGRTADIDRPFTFEQSADDLAALLKHLQIERADLFGESFGGVVALATAIRHPDLVGRVVVYSSPYTGSSTFKFGG